MSSFKIVKWVILNIFDEGDNEEVKLTVINEKLQETVECWEGIKNKSILTKKDFFKRFY